MSTEETVAVDGERGHYLTAGDSEVSTALLLHGGIIDAAHVSWGSGIEPLASHWGPSGSRTGASPTRTGRRSGPAR